MPTALVLGGAGTRGDFQVGAARFLYDRGERWEVVTGASGGAIVALKLAEGPDAVIDAERLFRGLRSGADIYRLRPWLQNLLREKEAAAATVDWIKGNAIGLVAASVLTGGVFVGVSMSVNLLRVPVGEIVDSISTGLNDDGLYDAVPLEITLRGGVDTAKVATSGIKLRLAVVGIENARLRYVTEQGWWDDEPLVTESQECSAEREGLALAITEIEMLHQERDNLVRMGGDTRAEEERLQREIDAAEARRDEHLATLATLGCADSAPPRIDLVRGAVASAAMPLIFTPVLLPGGRYVDGGLQALLPIDAARAAGATTIYAIYPKPDLEPEPITGSLRMAAYLTRSIDVMLEKIRRFEVDLGRASGATITFIQATVEVHSELTVDPGLTAISIGYGYMRASDVVDGPSQPRRDQLFELSDLITKLRMTCWLQEHVVNGIRPPAERGIIDWPSMPTVFTGLPDPAALPELRVRKWLIAQLVDRRRQFGGALPADVQAWTSGWEPHSWTPLISDPWGALTIPGRGATPAAELANFTADGALLRGARNPEVFVLLSGVRHSPAPPGPAIVVDDEVLSYFPYGGPVPVVPVSECDQIRASLDALQGEINDVNSELNHTNEPLEAQQLEAQLAELETERDTLRARAVELQCPP
jgi:NTE family protein